ncbi:MAG TPA: type 2 lanthipeptide synthetase LanM family protein [Thermoanaerobaculia bacterium]
MIDLRDLVARASSLFDRLHGGFTPMSNVNAIARRDKWRLKAAKGDDAQFARRLRWLDTTPDAVLPLLGEGRWDGPLPSWTKILEAALHRPIEVRPGESEPFGDLLRAFVPDADVHPQFRDDLLSTLRDISGPVLYLEFAVARDQGVSYGEFVKRGLLPIVEAYPVLARALCVYVELWLNNTRDFERALDADRDELARIFNDGAPLGDITEIAASHSDRHDGGRTVSIVTFASGVRLAYKPRDIGIESSWFALLDALNQLGGEFRLLRVLDRGTHGWVEWARHEACANADEARRYYVRAGMLLAVMYALEASDCFYENIVACGAWPVLVDMETLMHHVLRRVGDLAPAEQAADDIVFDSVLRAGFLPSWDAGGNGKAVDISGLAAETGQITPYQMWKWTAINTNAMKLVHVPITVRTSTHLPHLDGKALRAADYIDEVIDGFTRMYRTIAASHDALRPYLEDLGRREIRVVFHATRIYGLLLKRLSSPQHFRSGIDRSIDTDIISRFYLEAREKSDLWPILEAELDAMERLDIPRFAVRADSRAMQLPTGRVIEEAFSETAIDRTHKRINSFSDADLELQRGFIRASLALSAITVHHDNDAQSREELRDVQFTSAELIHEATRIAQLLEERAIKSTDGATWIAAQLLPSTSRYQLRPLRMDIYNGLGGLALFFSAAEHVAPGSGATMARAALSPLRRFVAVANAERMAAEGYTIGAATGAGSFVYSLMTCAKLLGDESLLDDARKAARAITDAWIAADDARDIMSGAAGTAIALLALYDETGDPQLRKRAIRCGEHLLGPHAWKFTGYSHGAAGIAHALLRLASATGDERFLAAAVNAIAWETSVFDHAEGNWPDFRSERAFMNAWCHGAAGIGMARLAGLRMLDTPGIQHDIEAAINAVVRTGTGAKDGLCCGALGRTELFVIAGDTRANDLASSVVARARETGAYRLSGTSGAEFFDPSLFQGLAGIGYELLRVARPSAVPSVLIWE